MEGHQEWVELTGAFGLLSGMVTGAGAGTERVAGAAFAGVVVLWLEKKQYLQGKCQPAVQEKQTPVQGQKRL